MTFIPGFQLSEAEPLLSMLASLQGGLDIKPLPVVPFPPANWVIKFDSQSVGPFDNRWQLALNSQSGQWAVLVRGTVAEAGSVIDDLLSVMIPANSQIGFQLDGTPVTLNYQLAASNNANAGVHLGFTLAMFILMYDPDAGIIWKLLEMVPPGSDVFIAGHSQGAAIATLARSYLNYLDFLDLTHFGSLYNYKSYVFAQPKPGNDLYGIDYDVVAGNSGLGFTVNNSQDWVPQAPLTIELPGDFNVPNPISVELGGHLLTGLALKAVESAANPLREGIAVAQVSKHLPKMAALAGIFKDPKFQQKVLGKPVSPALPLASFSPILPPILRTLNFTGCGPAYGLLGSPGVNPCGASDFFWQHHAAIIRDRLSGPLEPRSLR